ncbi:OsmC family protein [Variovorax sp. E3]|jgi:putative redox protein|uniref:OsmC family protein n=1 Tax=Variovorax sp. E3 TaxID=1914993 RepID=UPI0018DD332C|nr:OsmC family protein [Variovorax sp. E3]
MTHGIASIGRDRFLTQIEVGDRHRFVADEPLSLGGNDAGPSPYDLVIAGLGACTAITLRMYADLKAWPLESVQVELRLSREDNTTVVARTLRIEGLDEAQKARLAEVAERTPVTLSLKSGLRIRTTLD